MADNKRWQHDHAFALWMIRNGYAVRTSPKDEVRSQVSDGIAGLMWEAWKAGQDRMAKVLGDGR